jgi:hypothetical protein
MSAFDSNLLLIAIETAKLRWYLAGITPEGEILPLLRSQVGDFDNYLGAEFDDQVSFLRHRFSGVIQRGADRLLRDGRRPGRIVFLADGPFQRAGRELTDRVAEFFAQWMNNPSILYFVGDIGENIESDGKLHPLERLAGESDAQLEAGMDALRPALAAMMHDSLKWETAPRKRELADPLLESG